MKKLKIRLRGNRNRKPEKTVTGASKFHKFTTWYFFITLAGGILWLWLKLNGI